MAVRPLLAAAILALAAAVSQALEPEPPQSGLHVKTGANDYRKPRDGFGDTVVTMHASVQTASFAAVWFEYRTGTPPLNRLQRYVTRTAPIVVPAGSHQLKQRSRAVAVYRRFGYRAVARTIGSTTHGNWRYTLNRLVKAPVLPIPPIDPP